MSVAKQIEEALNPEKRVEVQNVSLQHMNGSVRGTININAIRRANREVERPGKATTYYLRELGLVVFDLEGTFDER